MFFEDATTASIIVVSQARTVVSPVSLYIGIYMDKVCLHRRAALGIPAFKQLLITAAVTTFCTVSIAFVRVLMSIRENFSTRFFLFILLLLKIYFFDGGTKKQIEMQIFHGQLLCMTLI